MNKIGHNNPPKDYDYIKDHIEMIRDEARLWLDGEKVKTEKEAENVAKLLGMFRSAAKEADSIRKNELQPFDLAKAKIQAKYNPLISDTKGIRGITTVCIEACKDALAPYLEQKRIEQQAAELAARQEAERKMEQAVNAIRTAQALEEKESAEIALNEAKKAEKIANKIEKERPNVATDVRAIGFRTTYHAEIEDLNLAVRHYWSSNKNVFFDLVQKLADQEIRTGKRQIPGIKVVEKRTVT